MRDEELDFVSEFLDFGLEGVLRLLMIVDFPEPDGPLMMMGLFLHVKRVCRIFVKLVFILFCFIQDT